MILSAIAGMKAFLTVKDKPLVERNAFITEVRWEGAYNARNAGEEVRTQHFGDRSKPLTEYEATMRGLPW